MSKITDFMNREGFSQHTGQGQGPAQGGSQNNPIQLPAGSLQGAHHPQNVVVENDGVSFTQEGLRFHISNADLQTARDNPHARLTISGTAAHPVTMLGRTIPAPDLPPVYFSVSGSDLTALTRQPIQGRGPAQGGSQNNPIQLPAGSLQGAHHPQNVVVENDGVSFTQEGLRFHISNADLQTARDNPHARLTISGTAAHPVTMLGRTIPAPDLPPVYFTISGSDLTGLTQQPIQRRGPATGRLKTLVHAVPSLAAVSLTGDSGTGVALRPDGEGKQTVGPDSAANRTQNL
jgi:hypothetical protein